MNEVCRLVYNEWLDTDLAFEKLDKEVDSELQRLLTKEDFDRIYEVNSQLQVMITEQAFAAGFEWGLKALNK